MGDFPEKSALSKESPLYWGKVEAKGSAAGGPVVEEPKARRYVAPQKDEDGPDRGARAYNLRQMLNVGMRALRDAEDHARLTLPAWPTADRIHFVHEQLSEDVLNGRTDRPSRGELEAALAHKDTELEKLREALEDLAGEYGCTVRTPPDPSERPQREPCREKRPKAPETWCYACVASAALASTPEEGDRSWWHA